MKRICASDALNHPWIKEGLKSAAPLLNQNTMSRRREEDCDGVKVNVVEESPTRPIKEKPKKSLSKLFNFQAVKVTGLDDNDSMGSTPKSEGGL